MHSSKKLSVGLLLALVFGGQCDASAIPVIANAIVTINATFTAPTCKLTMPDTVQLGGLNTGTSTHHPINIDIDCPDGASIETGLYAQKLSGQLSGIDKITMEYTSGGGVNPALFWLTESDGTIVKLDGSGEDNAAHAFCRGTAVLRRCILTPNTQVFSDTTRGKVSATVRFSVMYP
ncbi:fimbrial protein [Salmonella enterica]|nr:fimbrial protein [Salmonella enterica subsp. enterica serovar Typhimurium]ECF0162542.1 fimbrial protein [Salmonella enterica subsp. enterica serovar Litchfield]EHL2886932.1 fimbrial protein [Salmonella enterica]